MYTRNLEDIKSYTALFTFKANGLGIMDVSGTKVVFNFEQGAESKKVVGEPVIKCYLNENGKAMTLAARAAALTDLVNKNLKKLEGVRPELAALFE